MRYWAIYYYTEQGEDYDVKELLITEPQFRAYQKAYACGDKSVMFQDRQIAMSSIREVTPADDIVKEYTDMGVQLKQLGLSEDNTPKLGMGNKLDEGGFRKLNG